MEFWFCFFCGYFVGEVMMLSVKMDVGVDVVVVIIIDNLFVNLLVIFGEWIICWIF